jgi:cytochrome oxidase Cu insertion factor (SCO1/SenC/PrrC family)
VILAAPLLVAAALYQPPAPGTYELPPIASVDERALVDPGGARASLPGLAAGQVALVAFIYRGCHDAGGCPASLALLRELDRKLAADPARAARVRLVSVSFDPAHDTPARMAELRDVMEPKSDWRFLVSGSAAENDALLADYGQDVTILGDGALRHVLKVFLVDDQRRVRNVYSAGMLDPDLVLADVATIAP